MRITTRRRSLGLIPSEQAHTGRVDPNAHELTLKAIYANMIGYKENAYAVFRIGADDEKLARAGGIPVALPIELPKRSTFRYGGQLVDPYAVLRHEFEHTRLGTTTNAPGV